MQFLDKEEIRKILNLKGSDFIQPIVAERQLEVIRKGFNFLHQPENNALYIADEVGLGKTYIALGIASLMRHFASNPETYQDIILVPKENLQTKWEKEIRQFIHNNYCQLDNRVRSVVGHPVGSIQIKNSLEAVPTDVPGYHIYRNSSLSFGLNYNSPKALKQQLINRLTDERSIEFFHQADRLGYLLAGEKDLLKRFYAYLLSMNNAPFELVIVDEGHNFKYGLGDAGGDDASDRNNVAARFFGLRQNSAYDKRIFEDFPALKKCIKPKVEKLIVLSATPKTYALMEIKRQFDCFLSLHPLSAARTENEVKDRLNYFLIRGKMEYELNTQFYSRNQCREEHRSGNVEKLENAPGLKIKDNEQSLVMGLLQYNTIKHLQAKHNATFELGMLAGFETFKLDQQRRTEDEPEFEETRTRKIRSSQDEEILGAIINSYKDEFGVLPPHPKQDAIVDAVFAQMKRREKSLVFVRRVASAYELERRLLDKWEKEIIYEELNGKWRKEMPSVELDALLNSYEAYMENRSLNENLDNIFSGLISRMESSTDIYSVKDKNGFPASGDNLRTALYYVFNNHKLLERGKEFYDFVLRQGALEKYKSEFLECSHHLILQTQEEWSARVGKDDEGRWADEEDESYFFHSYFRQPVNKYFRKSRIYQADWLDLNFYQLNNHFRIAKTDLQPLTKTEIKAKDTSDMREVQEIFLKYIKEEEFQEHQIYEEEYPASLISKKTLITVLLTSVFEKEFDNFLKTAGTKAKRKGDLIQEIKTLVTIVKSTLRNGIGFLPLYIADNGKGDFISNYLRLITDVDSCFAGVLVEIRSIISDYGLLQAVNFPDKDNQREIEGKLIFQSPVKGMSGVKKNKGKVAAQFRMPGYPYVLVTTDIFREGEDLHTYCQNIYHYGIAWNCSDMEQRTGRIDRINSLSNRLMVKTQSNDFDGKIHVFYPYLEKTLEVNQVNTLFTSINQFTQAFDIVDSLSEEGYVSIDKAIEQVPAKLNVYMKSKFEHTEFKGYMENGIALGLNAMTGSSKEIIEKCLINIAQKIEVSGLFYFQPEIRVEDFKIIGDYNLVNRRNRRGPFRIIVKNDIVPGHFIIEVSGYLFKASSTVQKALNENIVQSSRSYQVIGIDDYHALAANYPLHKMKVDDVVKDLVVLVNVADEWEERITKGQDIVVFE